MRRTKAAEDGDFAKSFEVAIAMQVLGCAMAVYLFASGIGGVVQQSATQNLIFDPAVTMSPMAVLERFQTMLWGSIWALIPLLAVCWLTVVASHWVQTGVVWLPKKVAPDMTRISMMQMLRHVFSLQTLSYLFIGLPKFFLVVGTAVGSCWGQRESIISLSSLPTDMMTGAMFQILMQVTFHVGLILLISSAADYWVRWISFQRRIRMTDTEMREESRAQDGDPIVNSQRKLLYRK
jgi:flagellar biosynthesis protein FlhB